MITTDIYLLLEVVTTTDILHNYNYCLGEYLQNWLFCVIDLLT
jgi:hypothetical protein